MVLCTQAHHGVLMAIFRGSCQEILTVPTQQLILQPTRIVCVLCAHRVNIPLKYNMEVCNMTIPCK